MKNITSVFDQTYQPVKALLIYQSQQAQSENVYVEAYDMDGQGCPVNAHPLDVQESAALAMCLDSSDELQCNFLKPKGLLSDKVLYINPAYDGCVVWYTPAQEVSLFFVEELGIPNGKAKVPTLLWKADKEHLHIYALHSNKRPDNNTPLYHAPFFNLYENGNVCMGTVNVEIEGSTCLEDFICQWQSYFFNSYFSHHIGGHYPIEGNTIQLWQQQVNSNKAFPIDQLKKSAVIIKELIK
jgi:PRTRC genetic system protein B